MTTSKRVAPFVLVALAVTFLPGCTTANYGLAPTGIQDQKDTFKFKVYVGGFSGGETSDAAVKGDIEAYQKSNGYKDHKILDKRYNLIPSYFEYTVQFARD